LAQGTSPAAADPELEMAKPQPVQFPDMPWKKKPSP